MNINPRFHYPPPIATTLGFDLVESGDHTATIEIVRDVAKHANPMGTVHGGVLCDVADAAIGTAHATTLRDGESFTSLDLQISFFRPVWNDRIRAIARAEHIGKSVSRYVHPSQQRETGCTGDEYSHDIEGRKWTKKLSEDDL